MEAIEECGACSCTEDGDVADSHEGDTMEWVRRRWVVVMVIGLLRHNLTE